MIKVELPHEWETRKQCLQGVRDEFYSLVDRLEECTEQASSDHRPDDAEALSLAASLLEKFIEALGGVGQ